MSRSSAEVTITQYRALVELASRGPQSLGSLAAQLGMPRPGASRLVDRLVAKGLVEKQRSPTSGRSVVLQVTEQGLRLTASILDVRREELHRLLAGIPSADRPHIRAALILVANALGEERDFNDANHTRRGTSD